MCRLPKIKLTSFLFLPIFSISLIFGLWGSGFFEGYLVRFYIEKTFTEHEAQALTGKNVEIVNHMVHGAKGKTIGYSKDKDGHIRVQILWERFVKVENQQIGYPKIGFQDYVRVIE